MSSISKRLLHIPMLAMCLLFAMSFTVFAGNVAQIEETTFETLDEAINTAQSGETIKLTSNIDLGATGTFLIDGQKHGVNIAGKSLTLDLNGYKVKSTCGYSTIRIADDASLIVVDTSESKTGKIINDAVEGEAIRSYGELTIEAGMYGSTVANDTSYSLILEDGSETTINNGTFNGIIYTNGSRVNDCSLTINNGTYTGMLYLAGAGKYIINDGTFEVMHTDEANAVVEIKRGELEINGGKFKINADSSNNTSAIVDGNGSGAYVGTIIAAKKDSYVGDVKIIIKGGEIVNEHESGDAILIGNESRELTSTIEIEDTKVTGAISYYGMKDEEATEPIVTENNIILKGSNIKNNTITIHANNELKEGTGASLNKKIVNITYVYTEEQKKVISGDYGTKVPVEVDPERNGYEFNGWDKEIPETFPFEDMVITASWTEKSYSAGNKTKHRITVTVGQNGDISPRGSVYVEEGKNQTLRIKAYTGYEIENVIVDGKSVGAVEEYTFENVTKHHSISATFKKINDWENPYEDVTENDWFYDAVKYVKSEDIFEGMTETKFAPNDAMTRGMLVTVLYRVVGAEEVGTSTFEDVDKDEYYAAAIAWAEKLGIVNGIGDNKFAPDRSITREELALIMSRYMEKMNIEIPEISDEIKTYDDEEEISEYALDAVKQMRKIGLMQGKLENKFDPKGEALRCEVATILMRFEQ